MLRHSSFLDFSNLSLKLLPLYILKGHKSFKKISHFVLTLHIYYVIQKKVTPEKFVRED